MGECALFKLKSNSLEVLSTYGLSGCVVIAMYLNYKNKSYICLSHIQSDLLKTTTVENVINKITILVREEKKLKNFDFRLVDKYNLKIFIIATEFDNLQSLAYNIKVFIPYAYYVIDNSVAFLINNKKKEIYLIKPKTPFNFKFFGERYKGYGPSISKYAYPYQEELNTLSNQMLNSMLTLYSKNPDEIMIKNHSLFYILKLYSEDPELLSKTESKWYERLSNLD
jgi:hypothetical protein